MSEPFTCFKCGTRLTGSKCTTIVLKSWQHVNACFSCARVATKKGETLVAAMEQPKPDPVNHPAHYKALPMECIDIIEAMLTPEQFAGFCLGNAIKYRVRAPHKGHAEQDRAKADWYDRRRLGVEQ